MKSILDLLPLVPGPFLKAPAMRPFRPTLHVFDGVLAVHQSTLDDNGVVHFQSGVYSSLSPNMSLGDRESADQLIRLLDEYEKLVKDYFRHIRLVHERWPEERMGFVDEPTSL